MALQKGRNADFAGIVPLQVLLILAATTAIQFLPRFCVAMFRKEEGRRGALIIYVSKPSA